MMEPTQELKLIAVMMRIKELLALMVESWLEAEPVMEPGLEAEPEEEVEKRPGLLSVKPP